MEQAQQQPARQQHRRTASQPELELEVCSRHHSIPWDDSGSECSTTRTSSGGMDFQERCSAAVAKGLGPRAEADCFVADGDFDWEVYNWVFVRALDQVSPGGVASCACLGA